MHDSEFKFVNMWNKKNLEFEKMLLIDLKFVKALGCHSWPTNGCFVGSEASETIRFEDPYPSEEMEKQIRKSFQFEA
jgi:hypothetical protein